jgi:glyoxylase-like metal-dependent hydrolase (beta-lactamase superfamily II)
VQTIEMGDVSITRVVEWVGPVATVDVIVPESRPELWETHKSWLAPDFWTPETNAYQASMHSWLLRSAGQTIIVDTGVGNNKSRPNMPDLDMMNTGYLDALAAAGVAPEDVDLVINTHLHIDHVGWNTVEENGEWVPTFPNAKYLFSKPDVEYWRPDAATRPLGWAANVNVYEDSVEPIFQAGQAQVWDDSFQIDKNLRIDLAPGHTPGLGVITLLSEGERAVLVADLLHSPMQFVDPCLNSCFCEDAQAARTSRQRVLGWAADHNALVLPAHFAGHSACEITRNGSNFAVKSWAPFDHVGAA